MKKQSAREARLDEYKSLVRHLALRLKPRFPRSIQLEDLIQVGLLSVWTAPDEMPKHFMRKRIWCDIMDSVRGKEFREATHAQLWIGPSRGADDPAPIEVKDTAPLISDRIIAIEDARAKIAERQKEVARVMQAVKDKDQLWHPLAAREQRIIRMRFTNHGMTQQAAARRIHLTQQRLQQLEARAIGKLREKLAA